MAIFSLVFFKVLSSLLSVMVGYLAGRFTNVEKDSIASLLFYFVAPIVFFAIPTSAELSASALGVTLLAFVLCTFLGVVSYFLYGKIWQDSHRNMLALSAGTGNSGYIVLPIATVIFNDNTLSIYAFALIGVSIYEATVGCYFCARSSINTFKESVIKVAKLPLLNAFFLGCMLSFTGFQLPNFFHEFVVNMQGAYSILGMVMIGLALANIKELSFDVKFISAAFVSKFIFFPALFNLFILFDRLVLKWYDNEYYNALQLISIAPLATNLIVLASLYKIHPEKVATTVLLSLIFVLVYMPVMASIFLQDIAVIV